MPDLGKYAAEVLTAYAGSGLLLAVLVTWAVLRARAIRRRLEIAEKELRDGQT